MEIVHTFVQGLYSFKYTGEELDELERLFDEWNDIEMLRKFFVENRNDLRYYQLGIEDAIIETRKEVVSLRKKIIALSSKEVSDLDSIFVNLDDNESRMIELAKQKSRRKWLRLYALRIESNTYAITGGAIKLTRKMNERPHTAKELVKLEFCRNYLRDNGVFDIDSFNELDIK